MTIRKQQKQNTKATKLLYSCTVGAKRNYILQIKMIVWKRAKATN